MIAPVVVIPRNNRARAYMPSTDAVLCICDRYARGQSATAILMRTRLPSEVVDSVLAAFERRYREWRRL